MRRRAAAIAALALACAPALREPPPIATAPGRAREGDVDALLRTADAAWARRAEPDQARAAQEAYLRAAAADEARVEALLGAMRAIAFRVERERDAGAREGLTIQAVQLGQWCDRRAPAEAACRYRLAIALGQQARERTSTARDALPRMVKLLRAVIAAEPRLDEAGPHRVLALVLLRAPGWPVGPGDPEQALEHARAAAGLYPDAAENQLALGEALAANGRDSEARDAYQRAASLASREAAAGVPEGSRRRDAALAALARGGRR